MGKLKNINWINKSLGLLLSIGFFLGSDTALANGLSKVSLISNLSSIQPVELAQSSHVSGAVSHKIETHISGNILKAHPSDKNEPLFGASEETVSHSKEESNSPAQNIKKNESKASSQTARAEGKFHSNRNKASLRKACWRQCDQEYRSSIRDICSDKNARKRCRNAFFKKRMICLRKTCRGL